MIRKVHTIVNHWPVWKIGSVSARRILRYFIIGCVLALISDTPSSYGTAYLVARIVLYGILFTSLFFPIRHGLVFLLVIAVVGQDIVQSGTEAEEYGAFLTASIWQGGLGPLRPSWIIMAYCFALLIKSRGYFWDRPVVCATLWFATVPVVTGFFYGGFETSIASTIVVVDIKFPLMLITGILLYRGYLKTHPDFMSTIAAAFLGGVLARHFLTFLYWLNGIGSVYANVNIASVGSTKGTVVLLFLFSLYLMLLHRRLFLGGILAVISGLLIIVYTTRMLWLTTFLGVLIMLITIRFTRRVLALCIIGVLAFGSFTMLERLAPENIQLAVAKGDRFSRDLTRDNYLEQMDPARYEELLNFVDANMKRFAIFWGSGYGSYYTESARRFSSRTADAFAKYSFISGQYFTCHNYVFLMLFKHGILGFLIVSALWLVPGWRCFKILRKHSPTDFSIVYSSMVVFLPTSILCLYWSGKGDIISGFLIAFYLTFPECYSSWLAGNENARTTAGETVSFVGASSAQKPSSEIVR